MEQVGDRRPFNPRTGLPGTEATEGEMVTWYAHARAYAEAKWGGLALVSHRSVAEALVTVTIALSAKEPGAPEGKVLRQALFSWAFNPCTASKLIALCPTWGSYDQLRRLVVLVDNAVEHLAPLDRQVQRRAGLAVLVGRPLLAGLVRAVPVVVAGVLAED